MAANFTMIFNLGAAILRGIDIDDAAADLERLARKKGHDPLSTWKEVRALADRRIEALTPPPPPVERSNVIDTE